MFGEQRCGGYCSLIRELVHFEHVKSDISMPEAIKTNYTLVDSNLSVVEPLLTTRMILL